MYYVTPKCMQMCEKLYINYNRAIKSILILSSRYQKLLILPWMIGSFLFKLIIPDIYARFERNIIDNKIIEILFQSSSMAGLLIHIILEIR